MQKVYNLEGVKRHWNSRPVLYEVKNNGCWECVSHRKNRYGYISLGVKGSYKKLHRMVYELEKGELKPEEVVRHKCDNPPCFNPEHLEKGTQLDNVRDMFERGRSYDRSGQNNPRSKLSNRDVWEIKHLLKYTGFYYRGIGSWYDVHKSQIYMIAKGKRFKNIKLEE